MKKQHPFASRSSPILDGILAVLPHMTLILGVMLLVFFILDGVNPSMAFLDNAITKALVCIDAILTVILSVILVVRRELNPKKSKKEEPREF
ncbi:MAG: hypothetical protein IKC69_05960 [Clostridia bacterium]|nr:hypothetical protein [Clostridia bacterium]